MNEILQTLNAMDGGRLFLYGLFVLIALEMIIGGIVRFIEHMLKTREKSKNSKL